MPTISDLHQLQVELINTSAMLALEMAPLEREDYLAYMHTHSFNHLKSFGVPDLKATEYAEKLVEYISDAIGFVESKGGSKWGNA